MGHTARPAKNFFMDISILEIYLKNTRSHGLGPFFCEILVGCRRDNLPNLRLSPRQHRGYRDRNFEFLKGVKRR